MADEWNVNRGVKLRELNGLGKALPGLEISLDKRAAAELQKRCEQFPGVLRAAADKAAAQTQKSLRRYVITRLRGVAELQPAYISRAVKAQKTGAGHEVRVASGRIPLIRYDVEPLELPRKGVLARNRRHLSYRLRRNGRAFDDTVRGQDAPSGKRSLLFLAAMKSKHLGVFYRMEGQRGIREKYGPFLQWHVYADNIIPDTQEMGRDSLFNNLESELRVFGVKKA